jgi:hypothetical protein
MNNAMRRLRALEGVAAEAVPPTLARDLLPARLVVREKCWFLDYLYDGCRQVSRERFPDEVGYECFVNHFHLDDYREENLVPAAWAVAAVVNGKFEESGFGKLIVRHTIVHDGASCTYRFHVVRPGQSWLADDLEAYADEAVLVLDYETKSGHRKLPG